GEVALPYFTGRVTDWVASKDEMAAAWPMALLGLISAVTEFTCDVTYTGILSRALGRLQRRVFAAVLRQDVTSLQATGTGAVMVQVTGDVESVHEAVSEALSLLLWYLARGVFLLVTMVWLSPRLAFVTFLSLPVVVLLPRSIGNIQQVLGRGHGSLVTSACPLSPPHAHHPLPAMATVRSFAHEAGAAQRYHQLLRHIHRLEGKEAVAYAASIWAGG
ncbi:Antigen peptide transporter 1, partial [Buceros rhinoceros silvestris]